MKRTSSRRDFLKHSAAIGTGLFAGGLRARGQSPAGSDPRPSKDKLRLALIGVGGQGQFSFNNLLSEEFVALCDVDEAHNNDRNQPIKAAREKFPKAFFTTDFRRLADRKDIDAFVIATPDHTHALATMMAIQCGKHVYCEKPLTHTVSECRAVTEAARKAGVVTQMGTQIHSRPNYRRVVELVQSGAIGKVLESHVWCDRQWGGQDLPTEYPPVPEGLAYDLWLGPAPYRRYSPMWTPEQWRSWWDFGGGTLADMACHHMDLSFWALGLKAPSTIEAEGPPVHPDSCPPWLIVRYTYEAKGSQPAVKLTWYHGGKRPPHFERHELPKWSDDGTLFVGEKGMILANYDRHALLPEEKFKDFQPPRPFIPDSIGHHKEWTEAIRGHGKTLCNFDYAGALTEAVLLGNVAYRTGKQLEWDPARLKAVNAPEADKYLQHHYREGWSLT